MPSVIHVPTINIHDDTWLINNFFLWDKIFRIVPAGIGNYLKNSPLENALKGHLDTLDFIDTIEFISNRDQALARYESLIEHIQDPPVPLQKPISNLQKRMTGYETTVWDQKVTPALESIWQEQKVAYRDSRGTLKVSRFWADLWLIILALEAGKIDNIRPVASTPSAREMIRICAQLEAKDVQERHNTVQNMMIDLFLEVALPAPGFVVDKQTPTAKQISKWIEDKQNLAGLRLEYHNCIQHMSAEISNVAMQPKKLNELIQETRVSLSGMIKKSWQERLPLTSMTTATLTTIFQIGAAPGQVKTLMGMGTIFSIGYALKGAWSSDKKGPFLYEYEIEKRIR